MMSALPCIATLLELLPEKGDSENELKSTVKGRILLQNELSLAYWGKLDKKVESGGKATYLLFNSLRIRLCFH